jgi:hypothetical protein
MGDSKLRERLLRLAAELQSIASELAEEPLAVAGTKATTRTHCPICGESLDDGTRIVRGVHARCHKRLSRENRLGDAELSGILLPKEKTGRKTKINLDEVLMNAKSIEALAVQKTAEHRKKSKP